MVKFFVDPGGFDMPKLPKMCLLFGLIGRAMAWDDGGGTAFGDTGGLLAHPEMQTNVPINAHARGGLVDIRIVAAIPKSRDWAAMPNPS